MNTNTKTVFLAWQSKSKTRRWFPVGRLDADATDADADVRYQFRYIKGAEEARAAAGFVPLIAFHDFHKKYTSPVLFPTFQNRVMMPRRPDFAEYLRQLNLPEKASPLEILSVDGGRRATDNFEVFPEIIPAADGSFSCRFFLHGWSHVSQSAQERLQKLTPNEELVVSIELNNPVTTTAVQIQTKDYEMIGWAPRYLSRDLLVALTHNASYAATVVQVNPMPAPSRQRVLIELKGNFANYKPMQSEEFKTLI
ncbi:MAG: HIRAN domain-containing protein [Puniceicoccales bacterium]|jgi:hypothetical protein|nr:HIRAN domain-containing protein [Puniceicoccales bacterium]